MYTTGVINFFFFFFFFFSECAEGFFKGEDGNSDCAMCAFNFVNEGMGNTECIDCAPGYKDVGTCSGRLILAIEVMYLESTVC